MSELRPEYARVCGPRHQPPVAPREVRRACLAAFVILGLYLGLTGAASIAARVADFEYFYKAGAWLLAHGNLDAGYDRSADGHIVLRGTIEWYLPFLARFMTLITWLPFEAAGLVWLALNVTLFFATVRLLGRNLTGLPPQDWPVTQLLPVLLTLLFWTWEYRLNQVNNLTLFLLVAAFVLWRRGRDATAGFVMGLATLIKLTPGFVVLWFLLKRQYRLVAVAAATFVLAGPASDVVAFGPQYTRDTYLAWFDTAVRDGSHRGLILNQLEMDWRNQGVGAVLCRWLHPTNYSTHFDNDPRIRFPVVPATMNVANLPLPTVAWIAVGLIAASVLLLVWLARRPARELSEWRLRLEWSLFGLAMLWLMPVMRRYHLIWAVPAISVIGGVMHYVGHRAAWARFTLACIGFVVLTQIGTGEKVLTGTKFVEGGGALLLGALALAVPLVLMLRRLDRDPHAIPPDALPAAGPQAVRASPTVAAQPDVTLPAHA